MVVGEHPVEAGVLGVAGERERVLGPATKRRQQDAQFHE
jgi:hypothetical protein